jgi:hypothetical protein
MFVPLFQSPCVNRSFEHAHPDLADEHFLRAHRKHSSRSIPGSSLPQYRGSLPDGRQASSDKLLWKPAFKDSAANQDSSRDMLSRSKAFPAISKQRVKRRKMREPQKEVQPIDSPHNAKAFAELEDKISILQQSVQARSSSCTSAENL